ncbi:hypothetical protein F7725_008465 [Dissostichus mawsoni]|uniref:Legumain prodomain domain-containing protein n=1 Tax=Dissostichus mawsoni TaxID=36200 RepID=A0A7J5Y788_DISMA|nr:hypothetical protein F7725_008465 [Dissostichus mawsoni]
MTVYSEAPPPELSDWLLRENSHQRFLPSHIKCPKGMLFPVLLGLALGLVGAFPSPQDDAAPGKNWVVIVAGSNGWYNYRHQADACHAYQIVHKNGIPDEQIVMMMYDDLANNENNPTPGILITGPDVTPQNFLAVLKGDSSKVKGGSGKLSAIDLQDTIKYMHENKKYKKSSYACYYDEKRDTYLGDWYSVNWMEDSDVEDLNKETLAKQFKIVKSHTNTSHVKQFGNKTLAHMKVIAFQGNSKSGVRPAPPMTLQPIADRDLTSSPDVPLAILRRKMMKSNDIQEVRGLLMEINSHLKVKEMMAETMRQVVEKVTGNQLKAEEVLNSRSDLTQSRCYMNALTHYKRNCFNWHKTEFEYALRHLYALVNLCERRYRADSILLAMDSVCHFNKQRGF